MIDLAQIPPRRPSRLPAPRPPSRPPAPPRPALLGALVLAGFIATASGGALLWRQQQDIAARIEALPALPASADGQGRRLDGIEQRLAALEQRPLPVAAVPDTRLDTLEHRLAQLEQRPPVERAPAATPPTQPEQHLRLADETAAHLATLEQRVNQLEQRPAAMPEPVPEPPAAASDPRPGDPDAALAGRLRSVEQRLARAEQAISTGAARNARLLAAGAALEAGKPLGEIPGAPPELTRYGTAAPPTLASLRLAFPAAAAAATQAGDASGTDASLPERMWQQVQTLMTVQQGDKVLIGVPSSRVLAQAQARLDAGDLAGAVAALEPLGPEAAKAMAPWRAQAQALLDARTALAALARS